MLGIIPIHYTGELFFFLYIFIQLHVKVIAVHTGALGYDRLNGTRKIGMSSAKSIIYI